MAAKNKYSRRKTLDGSPLWQPRHSKMPLEEYSFSDREEHELAFAWAEQFGPRPGMPSADVLPPLPHPLDHLFAEAVLASRSWWRDLPLGRPDPRTPWRADSLNGRVVSIGRRFLIVRPYGGLGVEGAMMGWKATLLAAEQSDHDKKFHATEVTLVHARSRRPVRFDDRLEAERALEPMIPTDATPPSKWDWEPPTHDSLWITLPPH